MPPCPSLDDYNIWKGYRVERFIQTIQKECADHFLIFGLKHMDFLVREYVEHYHTERPPQALGNNLIVVEPRSKLDPCQVFKAPLARAASLDTTIAPPEIGVYR